MIKTLKNRLQISARLQISSRAIGWYIFGVDFEPWVSGLRPKYISIFCLKMYGMSVWYVCMYCMYVCIACMYGRYVCMHGMYVYIVRIVCIVYIACMYGMYGVKKCKLLHVPDPPGGTFEKRQPVKPSMSLFYCLLSHSDTGFRTYVKNWLYWYQGHLLRSFLRRAVAHQS